MGEGEGGTMFLGEGEREVVVGGQGESKRTRSGCKHSLKIKYTGKKLNLSQFFNLRSPLMEMIRKHYTLSYLHPSLPYHSALSRTRDIQVLLKFYTTHHNHHLFLSYNKAIYVLPSARHPPVPRPGNHLDVIGS
jgi:hypothetical protein